MTLDERIAAIVARFGLEARVRGHRWVVSLCPTCGARARWRHRWGHGFTLVRPVGILRDDGTWRHFGIGCSGDLDSFVAACEARLGARAGA